MPKVNTLQVTPRLASFCPQTLYKVANCGNLSFSPHLKTPSCPIRQHFNSTVSSVREQALTSWAFGSSKSKVRMAHLPEQASRFDSFDFGVPDL